MLKQFVNIILHRGETNDAPVSLDSILDQADQHLEDLDHVIAAAPESRPRTPFNANLPKAEMSMMNFTARQRMQVVPKMVPLVFNMQRGARMYHRKFKPTRSEASPEFIARLERLARAMGVKDIGYVKVPRNAIFKGKGIPVEYAIVFTVEMDKEPLASAPSFACQLEVMDGYKRMASIAGRLAHYLRRHGFAAYPGTALGGLTDYPHLAELADLGALGYHGLLISPGEGARLRINTIYTNITNLPTLEARGEANEHLWVRDFCAMCKKCVRTCPVNAIFAQPRPRGDAGMQTIDHATCRNYFTRNYGCGVCLVACPFSHVGYATVKERFKGHPAAPQFRIGMHNMAEEISS